MTCFLKPADQASHVETPLHMSFLQREVCWRGIYRRVREHKEGSGSVFTAKYKCHKLVYYEDFGMIDQAIVREKEIKSMSRAEKERLIDILNPERKDLFE